MRGWGSISKAIPYAPRRVLLALDVSPNQIWVKDSLIPAEVCHRQVQQAPTLLLYPNYSDLKTQRGSPGGPVVKTLALTVEKTGSIPGLKLSSHKPCSTAKKKKKKKINQVK